MISGGDQPPRKEKRTLGEGEMALLVRRKLLQPFAEELRESCWQQSTESSGSIELRDSEENKKYPEIQACLVAADFGKRNEDKGAASFSFTSWVIEESLQDFDKDYMLELAKEENSMLDYVLTNSDDEFIMKREKTYCFDKSGKISIFVTIRVTDQNGEVVWEADDEGKLKGEEVGGLKVPDLMLIKKVFENFNASRDLIKAADEMIAAIL